MYYLHFYSSNEKQLFTKIFSTRKNIVYTIRGGIYKRGKEKTRIRIAYLHLIVANIYYSVYLFGEGKVG